MEKIRIRQLILVEGRYDATTLSSLVEGLILTTDGFSIFADKEKQALIRRLGKQRGLLIMTDSDAAGFRIRHYLEKIAMGCEVRHVYIPALSGKESRKSAPSKEGTLGVEGMPPEVLRKAFQDAGVMVGKPPLPDNQLTYTDLFEMGLSGSSGSAARRRMLLKYLGLPPRLSKRALVQVLSSLYTRQELSWFLNRKPVLFWDFHGTLTTPDQAWFDVAQEAAAAVAPNVPVEPERIHNQLHRQCLPWFCFDDKDTRRLAAPGEWWAFCNAQFCEMFQRCGYTAGQAAQMAELVREKILCATRYQLYPDALDTLDQLHQRGYRSYILSNNFPELSDIVSKMGLTPYLDGVLVSGKIGYDKPSPKLFEEARRVAGDGAEIWMIGDNPRDDIEGASNAGFVTVAAHGVKTNAANYRIDNLADILQLLP